MRGPRMPQAGVMSLGMHASLVLEPCMHCVWGREFTHCCVPTPRGRLGSFTSFPSWATLQQCVLQGGLSTNESDDVVVFQNIEANSDVERKKEVYPPHQRQHLIMIFCYGHSNSVWRMQPICCWLSSMRLCCSYVVFGLWSRLLSDHVWV